MRNNCIYRSGSLNFSSYLCVGYANVNCVSNKINYINAQIQNDNIDIFCVAESWLVPEILDCSIQLCGFNIERADSPSGRRKHGVMIYIKDTVKYQRVSCDVKNVVSIYLPSYDLHLVCIYRPHSYTITENAQLLNYIESFMQNKEVLLLGDFNLSSLRWDRQNVTERAVSGVDIDFFDMFLNLGLTQLIDVPTIFPSCNIIDLCLCSHADRVGFCEIKAPFPSCDHGVMLLHYIFQNSDHYNSTSPENCERLWTKASYCKMNEKLSEINWEYELDFLDVPRQYDRFLAIINPLIDRFVPVKTDSNKRRPWSSNPPMSLIQKKRNAWAKIKQFRRLYGRSSQISAQAWNEFRAVNDEIKSFSIKSQIGYEKSLVSQLSSNPKLFHSYIKHRKVNKPTVGPLMLNSGALTDDPILMSECFLQGFSSVFCGEINTAPEPNQICHNSMEQFIITPCMVYKALNSLDPNSSMGGDGIHPRMLVKLSSSLALPLSMIFQNSLASGVLPDEWLYSLVIPIYTKGRRYDPLKNRPISLTCVLCKTLERIVINKLLDYLNTNDLISDDQYGFRSGRSTTDQLLLTYEYVSSKLDEKLTVDLIFFDFEKAFDKVNHYILIAKLLDLGIEGDVLHWIFQFLTNRKMKVRVAGKVSSVKEVTSGVPQGTCLGPILFLIFINHVCSKVSSFFKIFADDVKICVGFDLATGEYMSNALQRDIDLFVKVSESWGLKLNTSKCSVMRFSSKRCNLPVSGNSPYKIQNDFIKFVSVQSDLGVSVDRNLKFHAHVNKTVGMVGSLMTNMMTCTLCRSKDFMLNLYVSHIRPKIDYACAVWNLGYIGDSKSLERLQRRWTRGIMGFEGLPYSERLRQLDLYSVKGRLLRYDLILVWKIVNGECGIKFDELFTYHAYLGTRGHAHKLKVNKSNLDIRKKFFSQRVVSPWNSLKASTVSATSLPAFKRALHTDLGQKLYDYHD